MEKSGSGKTTLRNALLKENKELSKVVGYTTRQPRQNEVNGIDYHFVDKQDFEKNQNIILKRAVELPLTKQQMTYLLKAQNVYLNTMKF